MLILKILATIAVLYGAYHIGYEHGTSTQIAANYEQLANQASAYDAQVRKERAQARAASEEYLQALAQADKLHDDNNALIERLRQSELAAEQARAEANSSARCTVQCPPCAPISTALASDVTKLTREADAAAAYAQACYKWVQTLHPEKP